MKIISWNILANEFITKSDYPMIKSKILFNRNERLKNIMQTLLNVNADVMLLQEVMEKEFKALMQLFESKYIIVRGKNINWYNKPSASCNVTLLRKKQFKLERAYDLEFGVYVSANEVGAIASAAAIRPASAAASAQANAATRIEIINVHLNDESHPKRIRQIKYIEELLHHDKVILGGDFNQVYKANSQLYKMLAETGLMPTIHDPTYYIEKKMCIDNLMLKGFQLDNTCPIKKKNELSCCNNFPGIKNGSIKNGSIKNGIINRPKQNGSCVINKYGTHVENQFNAYGSDHLPIIANTMQ